MTATPPPEVSSNVSRLNESMLSKVGGTLHGRAASVTDTASSSTFGEGSPREPPVTAAAAGSVPARAPQPPMKQAAPSGVDSLWEQLLAQAEVEVQRDQHRALAVLDQD